MNVVFGEILMMVLLWVSSTSARSPLPVFTVQPTPSFMPSFAETAVPLSSVTLNALLLFSKYTSCAEGSLACAARPIGSTSASSDHHRDRDAHLHGAVPPFPS